VGVTRVMPTFFRFNCRKTETLRAASLHYRTNGINMRVYRLVVVVLVATVVSLLLDGCSSGASRAIERPITIQASTARPSEAPIVTPIAPPNVKETQDTVARLLQGDVTLVAGQNPMVLVGDFNGDSSPDLAVAVKSVSAKLSEVNAALANWTVQDPHHSYVAPKDKSVVVVPPAPKPETVKTGEVLLLVIHGYGPAGWRDPLATQTYLLREAIGTGVEVAKPSQVLAKHFGPFPTPRDVISEMYAGKHGVIYWTGAAYAWHAE
jgi:hypothetical protein